MYRDSIRRRAGGRIIRVPPGTIRLPRLPRGFKRSMIRLGFALGTYDTRMSSVGNGPVPACGGLHALARESPQSLFCEASRSTHLRAASPGTTQALQRPPLPQSFGIYVPLGISPCSGRNSKFSRYARYSR